MIHALFTILTIFFIEVILSIDNAAALALIVKDLPTQQQKQALKYGILGAIIFRGASLFIAKWLIRTSALKIAGGLYLLYLSYNFFKGEESENTDTNTSRIYLNTFWGTVLMVELMDMAFSVDNIFAATAISSNLYFILSGVFAGIISIRFITGQLTVLISKYPLLENSAFGVIICLGFKLITTGFLQLFAAQSDITGYILSTSFEVIFSAGMIVIFLTPLFYNDLD